MSVKKDIVGDAIKRTFSRSSIDGSFHDAEKEVFNLNERIELTLNRITVLAEDMTSKEICDTMNLLKDSLTLLTNKACYLRDSIARFDDK